MTEKTERRNDNEDGHHIRREEDALALVEKLYHMIPRSVIRKLKWGLVALFFTALSGGAPGLTSMALSVADRFFPGVSLVKPAKALPTAPCQGAELVVKSLDEVNGRIDRIVTHMTRIADNQEKMKTAVADMGGYMRGRLGGPTSSAESPADTGLAYRAKRFKKRRGNG